jgi:APA family basic amino acid/polyamine antiporter
MACMSGDLPRRIGFWGGSAIMVGIIIGSGIFQTPRSSPGRWEVPRSSWGLWVFGGILSLFGALVYAELAAMFPRSGESTST